MSGPGSFDLAEAMAVLQRTPAVLRALLTGLPDAWLDAHEGEGTWNAREVLAHLIVGEDTDWMPRVRWILERGETAPFAPFDRAAHLGSTVCPVVELLDTLAVRRERNLDELRALGLTADDLRRRGRHPALGPVTLEQLLATWVAHDLDHLGQIARVMAHRYRDEVGPWNHPDYLGILHRRK